MFFPFIQTKKKKREKKNGKRWRRERDHGAVSGHDRAARDTMGFYKKSLRHCRHADSSHHYRCLRRRFCQAHSQILGQRDARSRPSYRRLHSYPLTYVISLSLSLSFLIFNYLITNLILLFFFILYALGF